MTSARRLPLTLIVAFALFVLLGLPEGVLGTAWPSIRVSLEQPVSSLAWLLAAYTIGYFLSTVAAGRVQTRLGIGTTVAVGVAAMTTGLLLYASATLFGLAVGASLVLGIGGGTVDAALNAHVAVRHGPRAMNMLHAFFGVGATVGPLLMTAALAVDASWRWVYVSMMLAEVLALLVVVARRADFGGVGASDLDDGSAPIRWRVLGVMLVFFVLYVGIEASYGQWSFSVLTDDRGVGETAAGWAVAGYWGGLTTGRLALGVRADRFSPEQLLSGSTIGVLGGAVVFWWDPVAGADMAALVVLGLACAAVFPSLVLLTPVWLGAENTGHAVGYQLAAASMGVVVVSAILGGLVRWQGLGTVAPVLAALAVLMVATNVATSRVAATAPATVAR